MEGQWESVCFACFVARRKGSVALSWIRRQRWHSYVLVGSLCMNNLTCQNMMKSGSGTKEREAGTVRRWIEATRALKHKSVQCLIAVHFIAAELTNFG